MNLPILERYEKAKLYSSYDFNCIGAAFYLVGIDPKEIPRGLGNIEEMDERIISVDSLEQAVIVCHELRSKPGFIVHLAVIHPTIPETVIHRRMTNEDMRLCNLSELLNSGQVPEECQCAFYTVKEE